MARSNDPRFNNPRCLKEENVSLMRDVEELEDALMLHTRIQDETGGNVRNMLRKEIGGSLWQHGAEGRIHGYCSVKDLSERQKNVFDRLTPKANSAGKKRQTMEETRNGVDIDKLTDNYLITKRLTDRTRNASDRTGLKSNSAGKKRHPQVAEEPKNGFSSNSKASIGRSLMTDVDVIGKSVHSAKSSKKSDWLLAPMYQSQMTSSGDSVYQGDTSSLTDDCEGHVTVFSLSGERDDSSMAESSNSPQQRAIGGSTRSMKSTKPKQRFFKKVLKKYEVQTAVTDFDTGDVDDASCDAEVLQWLKGLQLRDTQKYVRLFADHEMDLSSLRLLTRTQLQQMGVMALGPLNKMVLAIRELRQYGWRSRATSLNCGGASSRESSAAMTDRRHSGYTADCSVESDPAGCQGYWKPRKQKSVQNGVIAGAIRKPGFPQPGATKVTSKPPSAWNMTSGGGSQKAGKGLGSGRSSSSPSEPTGSSRKVDVESNCSDRVEEDGDLNDLMSVSSIQKQSRKLDLGILTTPTEVQQTARESCRKAEKHLETLEAEIQTLQQDRGNPLSLTKIEELQLQLHEIQHQMLQQNQQSPQTDTAETGQLQNSPSQPDPPSPLAVTESDLQQCCMDNARVKSGREKQKGQTSEFGRSGSGKTVSISMTKGELLHEVRKQKQEHRRYIRHLQSELTRLKVNDPLRNCEVSKEDIVFDEEAVIGEGAFSRVFHGSFQGSEVALKRLKVPLQGQDQNYFIAEVNLLRELRHPRVVLLLGVCTSASLPIMVLEYMAQGSLCHYLHHPDIPSLDHAAFYQIARDMALGMNYLHRHRPTVLHLDLKSTNVLLNDSLRAKIADFGFSKLRHDADIIAKQHKHQQGQGHLKGTPAWMAPELFDNGEITPKCDVYSFSVILWEMVTGKLPYEGCSVFQVIERVRKNKRPEIPGEDSCPESLRTLIERCWAQKSTMRPHFKSILQSLDELQFPAEWRSLFTAAGVPDSTLDDVRSTRNLISLVSQLMEPLGDRPCGVPRLQLSDDDSDDASSSRRSGSPTFARAKSLSKKMVTESMTQEAVDEMDFMYTNRVGGDTQTLMSVVPQIDVSAAALATPAASTCFDIPLVPLTDVSAATLATPTANTCFDIPPVPPPALPLDMSPVKPKISPKPTKPKTSVVRESFLEELKAGLTNLNQRPPRIAESADSDNVKGHQVKGCKMADIRESMLLNQKGRLKSTLQPHPNQLHNLKHIDKAQLNSLTEIIRKAIAQRRTAMQAGVASLDESPHNSKWSVTDDWAL